VPKDGPSPAGVRGGVNDAIALYFRDPTLAATVVVPQEPPLGRPQRFDGGTANGRNQAQTRQ
jgi:hypothetical protein